VTVFLSAAVNDDPETLSDLVAGGVPVDVCDSGGEPALHLAARLQKPSAAARLLELGADVKQRGPTGKTVIHYLGAYPKTVPLLGEALRRGADVNDRDSWGQTPIMAAVLRGCLTGARALLSLGADPLLRDQQGGTVVHHFVAGIYGFRDGEPHTEQLDLLRRLVRLGVHPNAPGPYGQTAFTVAARKGLDDVLAVLREEGGRQEEPDPSGFTPLLAAAAAGRSDAARALLAAGVPLDFLSAVALGLEREVAAFLDEDAARADALLPDGRTSALSLALRFGHAHVARLLLERGSDPDGPDPIATCLQSAIRHLPDPEIPTLLLDRGANVNGGDGDGNTPLHLAAQDDRLELARLLLDRGADPNAATERGYTPLQFARTDAMRALLRAHGGR
jgi:ankyrin repeat protein